MDLNYRAVFRVLGDLLMIIGALMVLPFFVALCYEEILCARVFLGVGMCTICVGIVMAYSSKGSPLAMRMRDGFLLVAISWFLITAISALPFMWTGAIPQFSDAFFESCSGFTTTGATILPDIEAMPKSILFWRSFSHWIGGMGILIFTIALLPEMGIGGQNIARAETPGPIFSKVSARMTDTARYLYLMYGIYTVAETILLMLGGMDLYEALIHTFGTVGTGGFSMYNDSIAHFGSPYIEGVITVFMLLSGASFSLFFMLITTGTRAFTRDSEFKLYMLIFAAATILISLRMVLAHSVNIPDALRISSFQVASLLTTTGYATSNYIMWPTFCQMILLLLFFIGGCSGSTSSGVKVIRVLVLAKALRSNIRSKLHPNALSTIRIDKRTIPTETISTIASYLFLYLSVMFLVGCALTVLDGLNMVDGLSTAASCLGNVGPAFGEMGPTANYSGLTDISKYLLSFTMITGRLELYTILLLFSRRFWNPYRY